MTPATGIVLSQGDGRPLYLQIIEQIRRRVALGDWPPGHPLPSIRQLAVELGISVITVKRAYLELERDHVIATHHGKGSVVSATVERRAHIHEQELATHLAEAARLGELLGLGTRDLQSRLRQAVEHEADTHTGATKERT